eukprot:s1695_g2.t1
MPRYSLACFIFQCDSKVIHKRLSYRAEGLYGFVLRHVGVLAKCCWPWHRLPGMTSPRSSSHRSPRSSPTAHETARVVTVLESRLKSGSADWDLELADEVRQCPLGLELADEVRQSQKFHSREPAFAQRPAAGRSNSSLADVVVKNDEIQDLKESLHRGGVVIARKSVGELRTGFRIAAGQDLKLETFDITGLKDGDEVDPRLASVVQAFVGCIVATLSSSGAGDNVTGSICLGQARQHGVDGS